VNRNQASERRRSPRPPLWLNLLLLVVAAATFAYARHQREVIDDKLSDLLRAGPDSPEELVRMREELARMDLNRAQLEKELDARMEYLDAINSQQFYITIDSAKRRMQFRIGRDVAREASVQIGEAKTITAPGGRTWTFLPLKGGFNVVGKETGYEWPVPEWLYVMQGRRATHTEVISNGLGKYVIALPNHYIIHSPPPPSSPLQGPKPGSFMVPEEDLAAIWPRITKETRVYIF